MAEQKLTSIEIGRAALRIAVTENRAEEQRIKEQLAAKGIRSTAVDFGGEFMPSVVKIVERAVVAAQRQGMLRKPTSARAQLRALPTLLWSSLLRRRQALTWAAK